MFLRSEVKSRVSKAEEAIEKLQRGVRDLQLEWESAYDKLLRMVQRFTKRAEVVERAEEEGTNAEDTVESPPGSLLKLTPHQMEEQRKILARRARNGVLPR